MYTGPMLVLLVALTLAQGSVAPPPDTRNSEKRSVIKVACCLLHVAISLGRVGSAAVRHWCDCDFKSNPAYRASRRKFLTYTSDSRRIEA